MNRKSLIIFDADYALKEDIIALRDAYGNRKECRAAYFGRTNKELIELKKEIFSYNFNFNQNAFSHAGWIAAVGSAMDSIFENYIPDLVILCGFTMTSFATGISSYFIGSKVVIFDAAPLNEEFLTLFPMGKGLEILTTVVDIYICKFADSEQILLTKDIPQERIIPIGSPFPTRCTEKG